MSKSKKQFFLLLLIITDTCSLTEPFCSQFETIQLSLKQNFNSTSRLVESQKDIGDKISNMEACLGQKLEKIMDKIFSTTKKEIICPNNMICLDPIDKKTGRHLGCYEDNRLQRIFRGYVTRMNFNTKDNCIDICLEKRFVYAGTEASDWCFCGNSLPALKKRLKDDQCFRECPGNFKQHCGGPLAMNIYETGIREYRFGPEGNRIGESATASRQEIVLKYDCERKLYD